MTIDKLSKAIDQYLTENSTTRKIAAAKGRVTKLVNDLASELGAVAVREMALSLVLAKDYIRDRTELLKNRFTFGTLYLEGGCIFGWYDQEQAQAEALPLVYSGTSYSTNFYGFSNKIGLWQQRGFYTSESLPIRFYAGEIEVNFDVNCSQFWSEYGYARPCQLQWHRGRFDDGGTCLWVDRSIISSGFWSAYKWWSGCQWWYYERHPEWFADAQIWGDWEEKPIFHYAPEPDSAVLGGVK